jgi:solute carrier family 25 aspartate/glutamate transporter 12/13
LKEDIHFRKSIATMANTATAIQVKETVKEALVGVELTPELSADTRANFLKYARRDGDSEDLVMGEEEFINAIAPENEDYVSAHLR